MHAVRRSHRYLLGLVLVVTLATTAEADTIAFSFTQEPNTSPFPGTDGFLFIPTVPLQVTQLGYYDANADGLSFDHRVAIFDANTQAILAEALVGAASTLDGLFRYEAIAPLLLNAGQPYVVAGFHPGGGLDEVALFDIGLGNLSDVVPAPQIGYQGYFFDAGADLAFPTQEVPDSFLFGPNFQFQEVQQVIIPEPSAAFLVGTGLAGLAAARGWRRRRRREGARARDG